MESNLVKTLQDVSKILTNLGDKMDSVQNRLKRIDSRLVIVEKRLIAVEDLVTTSNVRKRNWMIRQKQPFPFQSEQAVKRSLAIDPPLWRPPRKGRSSSPQASIEGFVTIDHYDPEDSQSKTEDTCE